MRVFPARSTKLSPSASCRLGRRRSSVTRWKRYLSVECGGRASGKECHRVCSFALMYFGTSMRVFDSHSTNLRERLLPLCWFQEPGTSCSCKNPDEMIWLSSRFFYENVPETFWNVRKIYQPLKECPFLGGKRSPKTIILFVWKEVESSRGICLQVPNTPKIIFVGGPPRPSPPALNYSPVATSFGS